MLRLQQQQHPGAGRLLARNSSSMLLLGPARVLKSSTPRHVHRTDERLRLVTVKAANGGTRANPDPTPTPDPKPPAPDNGNKPFGSVWPWQFRAHDKTDTSADDPRLLMAIKLVHYFTLVAQGTLSFVLFCAAGFLTNGSWKVGAAAAAAAAAGGAVTVVKLTQLEAFLLVLGSVYQAAAGGFFIMAHEYDGWEIGRFQWPNDANTKPDVKDANNDRLRLVSYQLLWMFQGLGMGLAAFALTSALGRAGLGAFAGAVDFVTACTEFKAVCGAAAATLLLTAWFVLTPWEPNFSLNFSKSQDAARSPVFSMVVFILLGLWFGYSVHFLVGWGIAVPAVLCFTFGGLFEAFGAEGTLNQWWHLLAVVVISCGSFLLIGGVSSACKVQLPWFEPPAAAGAAPVLSAVGWFYVMLVGVFAGLIGIAHKVKAPKAPKGA